MSGIADPRRVREPGNARSGHSGSVRPEQRQGRAGSPARPRPAAGGPVPGPQPTSAGRAGGATTTAPRPSATPRPTDRPDVPHPRRPRVVEPGSPRGGGHGGGPRGPRAHQPVAGSRGRMTFLTAVVVVVLLAFAVRLVYVQVLEGPAIAAEARKARLSTVDLLGARGQITDRNGVALATSVERYDVSVNQLLVGEYRGNGTKEDPDGALGVAGRLAPLLGMQRAELGGLIVGDRPFKYLVKGVLPSVAREVRALRLPGINVDKVADRVYPNGNVAGSIIGFVNSSGVGLEGLELALDDRLEGTPGVETYERGAKGQPVPGGFAQDTPAETGDSVQLTLDADIQWKAQDLLDAQVDKTKADSGSIVVEDVTTGEILAIADSGARDPNNPGASAGGSLSASVSNVFEPGSTGKVITMAGALELGLTTPLAKWTVPYRFTTENDQTFKDSHEHPTLKLTTTGVLAESSNTGTVQVGSLMTPEQRHSWLTRFGFGTRTGIEVPGESPGIMVKSADEWDGRSKYAVLFGQAVSVTALQATQVFATIANGGVRVEPHVIAGWTTPDGTYTPEPAAARTRVVSKETAKTVLTMMESVVDDGTGGNAAIPGYRVAGKTGTAQNWLEGKQGITASFIGVVPADKPKIAVSVILHNPRTTIYGGTAAAPVFRELAAFTLDELGIAPSGSSAKLFPSTW